MHDYIELQFVRSVRLQPDSRGGRGRFAVVPLAGVPDAGHDTDYTMTTTSGRRDGIVVAGMAGPLTTLLREVDAFLMGGSKVHLTLTRVARCLDDLGIDFALVGGLAVGVRGHVRLTVDVDVLVTADGLALFKSHHVGRGYVERSPRSRTVRDAETGVAIDFLVAGEFPGDGRPKPVRFPDPASVARGEDPWRVLDLRTLVELKLASGTSAPDRLQDLADVVALIRANQLAESFEERLDPSVRTKYRELWTVAQRVSEPGSAG